MSRIRGRFIEKHGIGERRIFSESSRKFSLGKIGECGLEFSEKSADFRPKKGL